MFHFRKKKRYHSFLDEIPAEANATLAGRPRLEPAVRRVLDRHHKKAAALVSNTCADVDCVDALKWDLAARLDLLEQQAQGNEPGREDWWEVLRGCQQAALLLLEADKDEKITLAQDLAVQIAAAQEEEAL